MDLFLGTEERVRNNRCRRAISVRATEVLLYLIRRKNLTLKAPSKIAKKYNFSYYSGTSMARKPLGS
ncbi:MAG: hypothetical protein AB2705_18375, partial [Candidatus Thiodiazotropha sp.]